MQISQNTTGMSAGFTVMPDASARDHCVVVVKGTFTTSATGRLELAPTQRPLVYADEHYGDPGATCIRYESDFAFEKPFTDVVIVGRAEAPAGTSAYELVVSLEVNGLRKAALVVGERRWVNAAGMLFPSHPPVPFVEMPLTFERAFGGSDDTLGPAAVDVEMRNLSGVGFHSRRPRNRIENLPLPNIERLDQRITSHRDRPEPIGFGHVSRNAQSRARYAGTYDQRWLDDVCPFLPHDFDTRYFQCAPTDQQFPRFKGGESLRCLNMAASGPVTYVLPTWNVPIVLRFVDREVECEGALDTVLLEPHAGLAVLTWRTRVPLGKKLNALREIVVGRPPHVSPDVPNQPFAFRNGKAVFRGLGETVRWLGRRRKTGR